MVMPPELRPLHGRLAGREAGWATWSSLESSRSHCFLGYQSPGVCGGESPPRLLTLGCGGAPGSTPGAAFTVRRRSDGKVADSTARETGGKQQQGTLPSTSFYKTDAHGSNGVRVGPRAGEVSRVPPLEASHPGPWGERQLFCNLCSPAPRFHALWGKGRPGTRSRQIQGRAGAPPKL